MPISLAGLINDPGSTNPGSTNAMRVDKGDRPNGGRAVTRMWGEADELADVARMGPGAC
jgi:hypothetical protein